MAFHDHPRESKVRTQVGTGRAFSLIPMSSSKGGGNDLIVPLCNQRSEAGMRPPQPRPWLLPSLAHVSGTPAYVRDTQRGVAESHQCMSLLFLRGN